MASIANCNTVANDQKVFQIPSDIPAVSQSNHHFHRMSHDCFEESSHWFSGISQDFPAFSHHFPWLPWFSDDFPWFWQKPTGFPKLTGAWLKLCCCWCLKSSSSCDNLQRQTELKPSVGTNLAGSKPRWRPSGYVNSSLLKMAQSK